MFRLFPLVAATVAAGQVLAQPACDAPLGPIETCVVGAWIGSSDGPERMEQFLESMPPTIAASINDFGQPMGMIVYDTGFFETFPTGATLWALMETGEDEVIEFDGNLHTTTAVGYLSAVGGTIEMCHMPGSGLAVGELTGTSDGVSATVPIGSPPGASGALPPMTYSCAGDAMQMVVQVPAPLGPFTYQMTRVPLSRFPAEMRERIEERFAPAE